MKKIILSLLILFSGLVVVNQLSCKNMAKAAAKYWTKKQIKKFKSKCKESAVAKWNKEKGEAFCDCATDIIMEKYKNYGDAEKLDFTSILLTAKTCVLGN